MNKILEKQKLNDWVAKLSAYDVYGPSFDDVWEFKKGTEVDLDFPNTVHSAKAIVFPQRETLMKYTQEKGEAAVVTGTVPEPGPSVVFGVRACDAKALTLMDIVFGGEFKDPYYYARRDQMASIGLVCNTPPNLACFCNTVGGSPHGEEGLDVQMTDLGQSYYIKGLTDRGKELIKLGGDLFKDASKTDDAAVKKIHEAAKAHPQREMRDLDIKNTPAKLRSMFDDPLWGEQARACIECGICTFLCPTCHCFDMNDEVTCSSPCKGSRVRTWDTCQFPDFTMHTTGHNPRPGKASHLRQRINHKFNYFPDNNDKYQCTGCGRCISECPVGIDIIEVLNKVADHAG